MGDEADRIIQDGFDNIDEDEGYCDECGEELDDGEEGLCWVCEEELSEDLEEVEM